MKEENQIETLSKDKQNYFRISYLVPQVEIISSWMGILNNKLNQLRKDFKFVELNKNYGSSFDHDKISILQIKIRNLRMRFKETDMILMHMEDFFDEYINHVKLAEQKEQE